MTNRSITDQKIYNLGGFEDQGFSRTKDRICYYQQLTDSVVIAKMSVSSRKGDV